MPETHAPAGAGTVYKGADGFWHGRVSMGVDPTTGKRVRRHVQRRTRREAWEAVEALREQAKRGAGAAVPAKRLTVSDWVSEWLEAKAISAKPRTVMTYESIMRAHVLPFLGHVVLERLTVQDVNKLIALTATNSSSIVADNVRRTLGTCLKASVHRGLLATNPVSRTEKPKVCTNTPDALDTSAIRRFVALLDRDPYAARWILAVFCGLRQGEAIGLRWEDIDFDQGTIKIERQVQRLSWRHGCKAPCGKRPASCPKRHSGGLVERSPKSTDSVRLIVPPQIVLEALTTHRQQQMRERMAAPTWARADLVFTDTQGRLIDPRKDYERGKALLRKAGLPKARIHTLRHTAVTAMLGAGVSSPLISATMGWSASTTTIMLQRYAHVRVEHLRDAASALESSVFGKRKPGDRAEI